MVLINLALGLIGFSAITIQSLLLRELINLFSGNELIYGVTLSIWLTLTAIGSLVGIIFVDKLKDKIRSLISTQLLLASSIPFVILLSRSIKTLLNIPVGITLNISMTFALTILIFAIPCSLLGFQFTLGSKILRERTKEQPQQIGNSYILEAIGSLFGGAIFSFLFIYFFNAFQIAGIMILLLTVCSLSLYKNFIRKTANKPLKAGPIVAFALLLAIGTILVYPTGTKLDIKSSKLLWKGYNLIESRDSLYGRIAVIKTGNDISFFKNTRLIFSTAAPAIDEELIHLSFLERPKAKRVLIIGGGFGNVLNEAVKYKIKIDYIEPDRNVMELSMKHLNLSNLLNEKNRMIHKVDGIFFTNRTKLRYDLIIINVGDPDDALTNRYFTLGFFKKCKTILNSGGVLSINLSTSDGFMNRELKLLNSSIYKTLNLAFPYVIVIPSNRNYFFASTEDILTDKANSLINRWFEYKIDTKYFNTYAIPYIVYPFKIASIKKAIEYDRSTMVNSENYPISYFYDSLLWFGQSSPSVKNLIYGFSSIGAPAVLTFFIVAFILIMFLAHISRPIANQLLPVSLFMIGFIGMTGELLIIYTFQSFYGYIYSIIGFLMGTFMAGLALGCYLVNRSLNDTGTNTLKQVLLSLILLLILVCIYIFLIPTKQDILPFTQSKFIFPLFIFLLSVHIGAYFPVASKLYNVRNKNLTKTAGILYGSDLLGGALASLVSSIFLIPLMGLVNVALMLIFIAVGCLVLTLEI